MNEKPPQNNQEKIKMPDLVFEKKIKLNVGTRVKEQFIRRIKEYDLLNRGRIKITERPIDILESKLILDFLGTKEQKKSTELFTNIFKE